MDEPLVPMTKDGEVLEVHRTCVAAHQEAGWQVVPQPAPQDTPKSAKGGKKE